MTDNYTYDYIYKIYSLPCPSAVETDHMHHYIDHGSDNIVGRIYYSAEQAVRRLTEDRVDMASRVSFIANAGLQLVYLAKYFECVSIADRTFFETV